MLVGNKCDLTTRRAVEQSAAKVSCVFWHLRKEKNPEIEKTGEIREVELLKFHA